MRKRCKTYRGPRGGHYHYARKSGGGRKKGLDLLFENK